MTSAAANSVDASLITLRNSFMIAQILFALALGAIVLASSRIPAILEISESNSSLFASMTWGVRAWLTQVQTQLQLFKAE
jgi:hypothetical protein